MNVWAQPKLQSGPTYLLMLKMENNWTWTRPKQMHYSNTGIQGQYLLWNYIQYLTTGCQPSCRELLELLQSGNPFSNSSLATEAALPTTPRSISQPSLLLVGPCFDKSLWKRFFTDAILSLQYTVSEVMTTSHRGVCPLLNSITLFRIILEEQNILTALYLQFVLYRVLQVVIYCTK